MSTRPQTETEAEHQLEGSKKHTNQAEAFRAYLKVAASCTVQTMQLQYTGLCQ